MEEYDKIREMIKNENELINHRLTWLGTFQGLLFAALAFSWDKSDAKMMVLVFGILGISVAISIWIGTCRANKVINGLDSQWDNIKPKDYKGIDVEGVRSRSGCIGWLMPGYFIPWAFAVAWIALLFVNCKR